MKEEERDIPWEHIFKVLMKEEEQETGARELMAWLEKQPKNQQLFDEVKSVWDFSQLASPLEENHPQQTWQKIEKNIASPVKWTGNETTLADISAWWLLAIPLLLFLLWLVF